MALDPQEVPRLFTIQNAKWLNPINCVSYIFTFFPYLSRGVWGLETSLVVGVML